MAHTTSRSVAVIGGGAMGSAAAWQLAVRGHRVVLFEQFGPGHTRGASHGSSRIFRHAYPLRRYVDLASSRGAALASARTGRRATGLRQDRRRRSRRPGSGAALARTLAEAGLEHSLLRPGAAERQWPGLRFDTMVLHHPEAGRLHADLAVAAMQRRASGRGRRDLASQSRSTGLRLSPSGVRVLTSSGSIRFDQVVVAAGAWTAELLAGAPRGGRASGAGHHPGAAGALRPDRDARGLAQFHPPPRRGVHRARHLRPGLAGRHQGRRARHRPTGGSGDQGLPAGARRVSPGCSGMRRSGCPGSTRPRRRRSPACTPPRPITISSSTGADRSPWQPASPVTVSSSHRPSASWSPAWSTGRQRHPTCSRWVPATGADAAVGGT